jgi:hypothetical protein
MRASGWYCAETLALPRWGVTEAVNLGRRRPGAVREVSIRPPDGISTGSEPHRAGFGCQ